VTTGIDAELNLDPLDGEFEFDIQIGDDGDIVTSDQLETAIYVSLLSDRRAEAHQVPVPRMRRGWVGDLEDPAHPIGSFLWLLEQSRMTRTVAAQAADYADEALRWLVVDAIALGLSVEAYIDATRLELRVTLERPNARSETRYVSLWDNTGR
jgi:phage gp46-like protein